MKAIFIPTLLTFASINVIHAAADGCTLTGTYSGPTSLSTCDVVTVSSLKVSAGVTLDLSSVKSGATIKFEGTTTFAPKIWGGPLVLLTGSNLNVTGSGTLDGQGSWYWKQGDQIKRPVFLRVERVVNSVISGFTMKDAPYHNVRFFRSTDTTVTGLTLDSSAGAGLAKNTDGFGLSQSDRITITGNTVMNQDDCLAMQSSTNSVFSNNICKGSRGLTVGSIGGDSVDQSTTVSGLVVSGNTVIDGAFGLRIKAIEGLKGLVENVKYLNNTLQGVKVAMSFHSDYSVSKGDYTGSASSQVNIRGITVDGLYGDAQSIFDVNVNQDVVSTWVVAGVSVSATSVGDCKGQPNSVVCELSKVLQDKANVPQPVERNTPNQISAGGSGYQTLNVTAAELEPVDPDLLNTPGLPVRAGKNLTEELTKLDGTGYQTSNFTPGALKPEGPDLLNTPGLPVKAGKNADVSLGDDSEDWPSPEENNPTGPGVVRSSGRNRSIACKN